MGDGVGPLLWSNVPDTSRLARKSISKLVLVRAGNKFNGTEISMFVPPENPKLATDPILAMKSSSYNHPTSYTVDRPLEPAMARFWAITCSA